jgi:hypothetical protein
LRTSVIAFFGPADQFSESKIANMGPHHTRPRRSDNGAADQADMSSG